MLPEDISISAFPFRGDGISIDIFHRGSGNELSVGELSFRPTALYTQTNPALTITHGQAQNLMDSLWRCGIRPTECKVGDEHFAAIGRHLDDMRQIAFISLGINKPDGKE